MKWVQRDLEDQIKEELQSQKTNEMSENLKKIKISEVVKLMDSGYSRLAKDNTGVGSIQEKYNLSFSETKKLFANPTLKGLRRKKVTFVVEDDTNQPTTQPTQQVNNDLDNLFN